MKKILECMLKNDYLNERNLKGVLLFYIKIIIIIF